jgi:hypothetical protein
MRQGSSRSVRLLLPGGACDVRLHSLSEPFGIPRYYMEGWGAYERDINATTPRVGKDNTQKIESKHLNTPPYCG